MAFFRSRDFIHNMDILFYPEADFLYFNLSYGSGVSEGHSTSILHRNFEDST